MSIRIFVAVAIVFGLAFVFITPPFQVPDEVGRFWRAVSIAYGEILPPTDHRGSFAPVPDGMKLFVFVMLPRQPGAKITWDQFVTSNDVPLREDRLLMAWFPAGYTPVPYVPQIAAALVGRALDLRPVVTFYLGRLLNLALFIVLVAIAIRMAPLGKWIFCAAALLPMSLYLAASWSPDAATIAVAFLFTAMLLRAIVSGSATRRDVVALALVGALLGLSKPAYFLIAVLAFAPHPALRATLSPLRGARALVVLLATLAGVGLSMANAARTYVPRQDVVVDSQAQRRCIEERPLRFVEMTARHAAQNRFEYSEQMIGRLGLLELQLPDVIIWSELLLLAITALFSGGKVPFVARLICILLFVATAAGIVVATFVTYSRSCDVIEGIQGRYFIPALPVLLLAASLPFSRDRAVAILTLSVASLANALGVFAVACHYY